MATLYKCDKCDHVGDVKERFRVRLLPAGATYKDERTFDLCPDCTKKYLKDALVMLR